MSTIPETRQRFRNTRPCPGELETNQVSALTIGRRSGLVNDEFNQEKLTILQKVGFRRTGRGRRSRSVWLRTLSRLRVGGKFSREKWISSTVERCWKERTLLSVNEEGWRTVFAKQSPCSRRKSKRNSMFADLVTDPPSSSGSSKVFGNFYFVSIIYSVLTEYRTIWLTVHGSSRNV